MRRAKWGIGAAAVVGAAWLLSNIFNMGGLGTGEGTRVGLPQTSAPSAAPSAKPAPSDRNAPPQEEPGAEPEASAVATQGNEKSIGEGGVVEAMIDGRNFSVKRGAGDEAEWVPAEPDVIAGYARQAPGDESGVKVRVRRKASARASAEDELNTALHSAGLTDAQIEQPQAFVE
jgi:hypothetical protein